MIQLDVVQGSPEWEAARLGIPTASRFSDIMTPKTRKYSTGSARYMRELVFEKIAGWPATDASSGFMERGTALEDRARAWYEFEYEAEVRPGGFWLREDRQAGASPDALVGDDGLLEIKCLSAVNHIGCLLGEFPADMTQVQGQLWLTGRTWCDVVAWNPDLPPSVVRVWRDEEYIEALAECVDRFLTELGEAMNRIDEYGPDGRRDVIGDEPLEVEVLPGSLDGFL
jgi:hypothetical protein